MHYEQVRIYTDGGARGNPGPAGIGAVLYAIYDKKEHLVAEISKYIGEATNNQAEYQALIAALQKVREFSPSRIEVRMDSELVVKQMRGEYRVKNHELAQLFLAIRHLMLDIPHITFSHVRREKNTAADALVNKAIDKAISGIAHSS